MSIAAQLFRGLRLTLVLWLLTVVVTTLPLLGLARLVAPDAASGSLLACGGLYLLGALTCIGVIKNGGWGGWAG